MLRQLYMKGVIETVMGAGIGKGPQFGGAKRLRRQQGEVDALLEQQQVEDFTPVDFAVRQIYQLEGQLHAVSSSKTYFCCEILICAEDFVLKRVYLKKYHCLF